MEKRRRKNNLARKNVTFVLQKNAVSSVKTIPHLREMEAEIGKHVGVL